MRYQKNEANVSMAYASFCVRNYFKFKLKEKTILRSFNSFFEVIVNNGWWRIKVQTFKVEAFITLRKKFK